MTKTLRMYVTLMPFPIVFNIGYLVGCQFYQCITMWFYILFLLIQIVKEKDRFRKAPPNYAMKKTQLLKEKVVMFLKYHDKSIISVCFYLTAYLRSNANLVHLVCAGHG